MLCRENPIIIKKVDIHYMRTAYVIKERDYKQRGAVLDISHSIALPNIWIREYHQYEKSAIQEVKRLNGIQIDKLTAEIATLNGAIRGKGVVRMAQIREMLKTPRYFVESIEISTNY